MFSLVERYAPRSPADRAALAAVCTAIGALLLFSEYLFIDGSASLVAYLGAAVSLFAAYALSSSIVSRAAAAPEPDWWGSGDATDADPAPDADPVETLKRRYAEGELSTEEFEERLDRLVDGDPTTDRGSRRDREREGGRELERV